MQTTDNLKVGKITFGAIQVPLSKGLRPTVPLDINEQILLELRAIRSLLESYMRVQSPPDKGVLNTETMMDTMTKLGIRRLEG